MIENCKVNDCRKRELIAALRDIKNFSSGLTGKHGGWEVIHQIADNAIANAEHIVMPRQETKP